MLRSLHVENFRALREFRMAGLGRVNLLVGTNNCGKTSVLEAVHVLLARSSPGAIWRSLYRRGELRSGPTGQVAEVGHLFHGHGDAVGASFSIDGRNDRASIGVGASIRSIAGDRLPPSPFLVPAGVLMPAAAEFEKESFSVLEVVWRGDDADPETMVWPIVDDGGLEPFRTSNARIVSESLVQFVTTEGLLPRQVVELFGEVALTSNEAFVIDALCTIEPGLERIAIVDSFEAPSTRYNQRTRGGLAAMLDGVRVPIGSMGDGIWRLLGIALSLVRARDGVLLVDEIDTGLHYSVLEKMWRLVFETAERLNVQVFATTHSRDCYEALAAITQPDRHEVSIQRIERGRVDAVSFDEGAISAAAARDIEVR